MAGELLVVGYVEKSIPDSSAANLLLAANNQPPSSSQLREVEVEEEVVEVHTQLATDDCERRRC